MPTGPQGQKRPADVISNAVHVCKIAVGDIEETLEEQPRQPNKAKGGRAGGKARARDDARTAQGDRPGRGGSAVGRCQSVVPPPQGVRIGLTRQSGPATI